MSPPVQTSRIPLPVTSKAERYELCEMEKAPAPVGKAKPKLLAPHWSRTFVDAIDNHVWRKQALDAFETHSFVGRPGTERWCTRCTLMLPADWKDPKKPVPLACGDRKIVVKPAMYEYVDGNPLSGVRPVDPHYSGAKVKNG